MIPDAAATPHVLREYSFLADGQRGALVGPRGDMSWLCVPGWDDDAVFATLLGGRGMYSITPAAPFVWGGSYEPGTLLWRSRWVAGSSEIGCREALAFPGDPHRAVVLRRIVAERHDAEVDVLLRPAACFGARPLEDPRLGADGVWRARSGPLRLRWSGAPEATVSGSANDLCWRTRIRVPAGEYRDLVLELADIELLDSEPDPEKLWAATESAWKQQTAGFAPSVAPRDAVQAYAVLRGMTCDTGGMVAAATTSRGRAGVTPADALLPARPHGDDHRGGGIPAQRAVGLGFGGGELVRGCGDRAVDANVRGGQGLSFPIASARSSALWRGSDSGSRCRSWVRQLKPSARTRVPGSRSRTAGTSASSAQATETS